MIKRIISIVRRILFTAGVEKLLPARSLPSGCSSIAARGAETLEVVEQHFGMNGFCKNLKEMAFRFGALKKIGGGRLA